MLICPQCKFENPDANNFCQNCGTSLTQKNCPECGAYVALNAQCCHKCGAECTNVWWAMITQQEQANWESETSMEDQEPASTLLSLPSPAGSYLDQQQRYQLLEPLPPQEEFAAHGEAIVRVLDCQPFQISPLAALVASQHQGLTQFLGVNDIPSVAKPYIALQSKCYLGIPPIHDAWQQGDFQVVLLEDRSNWQYLLDLWQKETLTSLQIIHYFYQMTQLWSVLETVNCRQSLLDLSNLRLDEDQALGLQRLHLEIPNDIVAIQAEQDPEAQEIATESQTLTIQALGRVWQALFRQSQRTQFGSLIQLLGDLETGKIQALGELQLSLKEIAHELQPASTAGELMLNTKMSNVTEARTVLQLDDDEENKAVNSDDLPTMVLPMQLVNLDNAGLTDVGRQRDRNEDFFGVETVINKLELPNCHVVQARGLYILCDGMGGHAGGEVASALAVNTLRQYFQTHWVPNQLPSEEVIQEAIRQANRAIYDINQQDARSGVGRMGTTLVMVLVQDTQVAVAHVGDSPLYRLTRKGGLERMTVDHEVGQREISRGVEPSVAYSRPDAYQLTQALGPRDENFVFPDIQFFEIHEDTLFLLASDGLSDNNLIELHWQTYLHPLLNSGTNLENGVRALIDLANDYNGHDNITAVVIRAKVRPFLEQPS